MSSHHCYLCASDEGILLDIFADGGKTHCGKLETCLSVKIDRSNATSTKICHKCAYELDACSKFVQKYRETRDVREARNKRPKGHCVLCSESGKKGYIFELGKGTPLNNSLRKIRELFNDNFFNDQPLRLSICLNCRYNLDVLSDLKNIYQTTLDKFKCANEEGRKTLEYPRTRTSVVSRKTTYTPLPQLNGEKAYETDCSASSAMPMRRMRGRPRKESISVKSFRICEQCGTAVQNGMDMYRYHRTGRTVCKDCWLTMDPEKVTNNKRKKLGLVLKDVLSNPSKYKSMYKVERDEQGNTTFLITDDSSANEDKEKTPVKKMRRTGQGSVKSMIREETVPDKKKPVKRVVSGKLSDREYEPPKKITVKDKKDGGGRNGIFTSDSELMVLRTRRNSFASSEKSAKAASLSDLDSGTEGSKKGRPRKVPVLSPVPAAKISTTTKARRATQSVASTVEKSDKVARPLRRTRANSLTGQDAISLANHLTTSPRSSKSLSESGLPLSKTTSSKTTSLSPTNVKSDTEPESSYSCSVCKLEYKNKLIGMAHELTHAKQPEVKLQRVTIPEVAIVEEEPAETSSFVEEPEEQSHDVSSTSDHRPENVESEETPAAETPMEIESIQPVDTNIDEGKEKIEKCVEEVTVDVDEKKNAEVVSEDCVKVYEKYENEDKTDTPVVREPETNDENTKPEESNVDDDNPELNKSNDDKVTEEMPERQEKPVPTPFQLTEQSTEKELANDDSVEKPAEDKDKEEIKEEKEKEKEKEEEKEEEEALKESTETPINANGVDAKHDTDSALSQMKEMEKSPEKLDIETDLRIVDACNSEETIEPDSIPPKASETPEKESPDINPVNNEIARDDEKIAPAEEADNESLQSALETAPVEAPVVEENIVVRKESKSISVVTEVLREVFDLATAEIQKRLETERPNDQKCTTSVPETLENISREIQNSADMPSLEPLTEDPSSNNQS